MRLDDCGSADKQHPVCVPNLLSRPADPNKQVSKEMSDAEIILP
jgi:hypothetical protein